MVMEQVVMGVSSGLDIIPAVSEASRQGSDGVSKVFRRVVSLAEGGLPVEEAFRVVSDESDSAPLKHALIHLSLAYKQGGEVIRPLRELSDATQSHYQDRVEEEISKLPVKGILPLITIFAGLLICFLTIPLVQVGSITSKVTYGAR
jgi:pilus assembly protein TadC